MNLISEKRKLSEEEIAQLNIRYKNLSPEMRISTLYRDFETEEVMLTSSFAATSALLLKLISGVNNGQPVFFIDTGYHFPETLQYLEVLKELLDLNVFSIKALEEEHQKTLKEKTWTSDPDQCCFINKVQPLDRLKSRYTVWISGLMEWQSDHRKSLNIFENRGGILKFYPLLDVTKKQRDDLIARYALPYHPLLSKGYHSIGCENCTVPGDDRNGRWNNNPKTECGLHL